jgi:hypothetical protein
MDFNPDAFLAQVDDITVRIRDMKTNEDTGKYRLTCS